MPSTCPHCGEHFGQWMLYKMHLEAMHTHKVEKHGVKHPLSQEEKRILVNRLETKLGKEHFYGL